MLITVIPYDPKWPALFQQEAKQIHAILGDLLSDIHHIGSTAIPGIYAKPVIDIIPVVKDITLVDHTNEAMQSAGYTPKGEFGIPFRRYFQKENEGIRTCNIHIYEAGNAEIERHLAFKNYMLNHKEEAKAYSDLKQQLALTFPDDIIAYCNGKEDFIRKIDNKAGPVHYRMMQVCTNGEWQAYHRICKEAIFDETEIEYDPNHPTLRDPAYTRFIFLKGADFIGVLVVQSLSEHDAAIRILAIDAPYRNQGLGKRLVAMGERWLRHQRKKHIFLHANPRALSFYRSLGYENMPFPGNERSVFKGMVSIGKPLTTKGSYDEKF